MYFDPVLLILFQWSQSILVTNKICMKELPAETGQTPLSTVPKCVAPAAFTSQILASISHKLHTPNILVKSDSDADTMETSSDQQPETCLITSELVLDVLYGVAFCRAVLGPNRVGV